MAITEGDPGKNEGFKLLKNDFYLVTAPWWMRALYPGCTWDRATGEKIIYLSFDDGPHPEITPFVLRELKQYDAKATFFCIGDNVRKFPDTYHTILEEGHSVGNHTMHHLNGWNCTAGQYLNDINEAGRVIDSDLFRPPYGRIKKNQLKALRLKNNHPVSSGHTYQIIMWSVLAGDWDTGISPEKCFERVKQKIYPGCIVVFHDSDKANERMSYALPKLLDYFSGQGYRFAGL